MIQSKTGPHYSQELRASLSEEFGIPRDVHDAFFERLEGAADVWEMYSWIKDAPARHKELREYWADVEKRTKALSKLLSTMPEESRGRLSAIEMDLLAETVTAKDGITSSGLRVFTDDETGGQYITEVEDMIRGIDGLIAIARRQLKSIPRPRKGHRSQYALYMWMTNFYGAWTETLGRAFTVYFHGGVPVSQASHFAFNAFKHLDPDIPCSTIESAMRERRQIESER